MLDHRQCQAFLAVAETGSFEKAAELLCITPAAASLRVQALEKRLAQILLIRGRPCQVTQAGQEVLYYLNNMQRFEQHLLQRLQGASAEHDFVKVILGVNADSLATWLLPALQPVLLQQKILLELKLDDQSQTYLLLQEGTVNACISIESEPMKGCQVQCLGSMRYRMVASAAFAQQWFKQGVNRHTLRQAPAVIFNAKDRLHVDLLEQHFGLMIGSYPYHFVPSSEAFVDMIQRGLGYGVVPELQLGTSLQDQTLIDLLPDLYQDVVLYWHDWQRQSEPLNLLRQQVVQQSQQYLLQL